MVLLPRKLGLRNLIEKDSKRNEMKSSTLVYWVPSPRYPSLGKLRYFLVQRRLSFHATSLSPFASMVKKISEYLETLSALFPSAWSAKSAIRGTWTVSLAWKLLFRRSTDMDYRKIEEKKMCGEEQKIRAEIRHFQWRLPPSMREF